ncbi:MAG: MMPL family transporter, partial [candidate division Zixibacteria bacterium]|nr:MMPL family transporter [candidate division Zixibacteria bacterium]
MRELNLDPSLISYFAEDSEIAQGLTSIDRNGGSNPLIIVVQDVQGHPLNSKKTYLRLWGLHNTLEDYAEVGTVLSLPTLIAEGKRRPFGFFFSVESILRTLEKPQYDRISKSFTTPDRKSGLFLIRMREVGRKSHRLEIIGHIEKIVRDHGFVPTLVGGIYALQGRLSEHIAYSMVFGLGQLIGVFAVIALIIGRSWQTALAMTLSISLIPLCIFGGIGFFRVPVDIISAPAANVAIGMGIDAMIHIVHAHRRLKKRKTLDKKQAGDLWLRARRQMWEPIITSMFIVSAG